MQLRDDRQAEKLVARAERGPVLECEAHGPREGEGSRMDEAAIRSAIENLARLLEG